MTGKPDWESDALAAWRAPAPEPTAGEPAPDPPGPRAEVVAIERGASRWRPYHPLAWFEREPGGGWRAVAEVNLHDNVYFGEGRGATRDEARHRALLDLASQWRPFRAAPVRHDRPWPERPAGVPL